MTNYIQFIEKIEKTIKDLKELAKNPKLSKSDKTWFNNLAFKNEVFFKSYQEEIEKFLQKNSNLNISKEDLIRLCNEIESFKFHLKDIEISPDILQEIIEWKEKQIKEKDNLW